MSKTVDERVVSMEFDNKRFESNVQTSLGTIEKLKQSLKFQGVSDSLSGVNKSIKNTDLSPLGNAAHNVGLKFSALYSVADQAFRNITNSAMNYGKRIASAFTIDPIKTGMNEYELKMGSVQTILASTGESLDTVNRYLEELNAYSDQTIYSFQDMTNSIGKFTNAGVSLEDAVLAIKGVSNEAAVSGANAAEASRAMYNFAQSLSAGSVKLMDWKSIENANMATVEFKDQLIATAVELGTVTKTADGMYKTLDGNVFNATKGFNEVLQDQWMTSEVLITTLKQYADETTEIGKKAKAAATEIKTFSMLKDTLKESVQSGWAQSWEIIIGDFEEAKALWTKVGEVLGGIIDKTSKARNELLGKLFNSKFDTLISKINAAGASTSDFEASVKKALTEQGKDYDAIIEKYGSFEKAIQKGAISSDILKKAVGNLSKSITSADLNIVDKVLGRGDTGDQVKQVQQALTDLGYDIGEQFGVDGIIGKYTEGAIKEFQKAAGLEVTGIVDETTLAALKKATSTSVEFKENIDDLVKGVDKLGGRQLIFESFGNIFEGLKNILATIKQAFRDIFPEKTAEEKASKLYNLIEGFNKLTEKFKNGTKTSENLRKIFKGLFGSIALVWDVIKSVGKSIGTVFGGMFKKAGGGIVNFAGKIGDAIAKFRDWLLENDRLTNAFTRLFNGIKKVIDKIKGWFVAFKNLPFVTKLVDKFKAKFQALDGATAFDKIATVFKKVGNAIKGAFNKVKDWFVSLKDLPFVTKLVDKFKSKWQSIEGTSNFDKIATIFKKIGSAIKGAFNKVKEFIKGFKEFPGMQEGISKFREEFKKFFASFKGKWSTGLEKIKDWIKSIKEMDGLSFKNIKKAFVDFKDNVLGHFFKNGDGTSIFSGLINAIKNLKEKVKEYLESAGISFDKGKGKIVGFFTGIKDFLGNNWGKILGIAAIIGGLIGIVTITKKVLNVFETLKSPIETLTEISDTFKDLSKSMKQKMKADSIKSIAIAIGILAASVFLLTKADQGKMWSAIGAIVVLAAVLTAMTVIIGKKVDPVAIANISKAMLSIGGAMLMMAGVAKILASMSWGDLAKGGAGIVVFLGLMVGMMAASKLIGTKDMNQFGSMMLKLSGALLIMAIVTKMLGKMDRSVLIQGGIAMATFMGMMAAMMVLTKFIGSEASKFGSSMLALAAGLLVMTITVRLLGGMKTATIIKGGIAIGAFMGMIGAMLLLTKLVNGSSGDLAKFGTMMLGISAAMLLMSASVAILGSLKTETLVKGVIAVAALGAIVAGFMALSKFAGKADVKTIIGMAAAVGILSIAVLALTIVDTGKLWGAVGALTIIMAVFAGLAMSTKMINTKSIGTLLVLAGIVALIAGVFILLSKLQIENVLGIATGLSATMLAVGATCAIISRVPIAGALKGIVALAIVIAGMGLIMTAIGLLVEKVPNLGEFINNAIPILESLGTGLGTFVGSIIGSFGEAIASSLPNIATSLSEFATNLQPFIDSISGIDTGLLTSVGSLTGALAAITAASVLDSIFSWVTGGSSITSFCEQLLPFGNAMVNFSSAVSGKIDEGAVTAAANAGKMMTEMAKTIPNSGGVLGFFAGENDLDTFASKLVPFGWAIVRFSSVVAGKVDEAGIQAAANAGKMMTSMADTIPNSGGVVGFFAGENDLDTFASKLVPFGWAIVRFSNVVSGNVDEAGVQAAANAGKMMTSMADTIPNSGGVVGFFAGENDLDTFAAKLVPFGWAIVRFSSVVAGNVDEAAIQAAANAGKIMTSMADTIPNSGGVLGFFAGENDLDAFAAKLVPFGWAIRRFSSVVAGNVDEAAVTAAANAGGILAELESALPNTGGFVGWLTGKQDLGDFATNVENFGSGIAAFGTSVAGIDTTSVTTATTAANDLLTLSQGIADSEKTKNLATFGGYAEDLGKSVKKFSEQIVEVNTVKMASVVRQLTNLADVDLSGMESLGTSLATVGTTSVDSFLDSFENSESRFKNAGTNLMISLGKGISSKLKSLKTGISTVAVAMIEKIEEYWDDFYDAGEYLVKGFAKGIDENTWRAEAKARAMAKAAEKEAEDALGIQSPSRVFYRIGAFTGQGFVNALNDYEYKSRKAGAGIADSARSGLSKAIGRVQEILSKDVDAQPTIRPVLDLSDVASGAGSINRMLSMNPSVGVMANVGAINSTMGRIQGGTSNDDVVSAIKDLGSKLGKTAGDTYSVNGITYDDGSAVSDAVKSIVRAAQIERRR